MLPFRKQREKFLNKHPLFSHGVEDRDVPVLLNIAKYICVYVYIKIYIYMFLIPRHEEKLVLTENPNFLSLSFTVS